MPYSSLEDVPENLKGAGLSLPQANKWAAIFDAVEEGGGAENPAAVAWTQFKEIYKKEGDGWVKKETQNEWPGDSEGHSRAAKKGRREPKGKGFKKWHYGEGVSPFLSDNKRIDTYSTGYKYSISNQEGTATPLKIKFIAQTEGSHEGNKGEIYYSKEELLSAKDSLIHKDVKDDPIHKKGTDRNFSEDIADIVNVEYVMIDNEMIEKYELDATLNGKAALVCDADVTNPTYEEMINRKKIQVFSTELECDREYNPEEDRYEAKNIKFDNVAAIREDPADVGAVMLEVIKNKKKNMEVKMPDVKNKEAAKKKIAESVKNLKKSSGKITGKVTNSLDKTLGTVGRLKNQEDVPVAVKEEAVVVETAAVEAKEIIVEAVEAIDEVIEAAEVIQEEVAAVEPTPETIPETIPETPPTENQDEVEALKAEIESLKAENEALKAKLAEKEGTTEEETVAMKKLKVDFENQKKSSEKQATVLNGYVKKDREELIKTVTTNKAIVEELTDPVKTSEEVFSKELDKLKTVADEAAAKASIEVNNAGSASLTTNKDSFSKNWDGQTKEDVVNKITNMRGTSQ